MQHRKRDHGGVHGHCHDLAMGEIDHARDAEDHRKAEDEEKRGQDDPATRLATRLAAMPDDTQERLINWGYAVCDAAMRRWVDHSLPPPAGFPYPRGV